MNTEGVFGSGFDQLAVGDGFETGFRTIDERDLDLFSDLTGDHHPLHTDPDWAASSPFGGRIAHGMLLLSFSVGLAPIDPDRVLALRGFDRVVFKRPVGIGDAISLRGKVEELKPVDGETGLARFGWTVVNQDEKVVLRARAEIVWRRTTPDRQPVYL